MPIPFARLDSESTGLWNLQLHFWRNAVEHFRSIQIDYVNYDGESIFGVDACMVIVLAGTSASQLLGQQWVEDQLRRPQDREGSVPSPKTLCSRMLEYMDSINMEDVDVIGLHDKFSDFMDLYDNVRHFGEPKHLAVSGITPDILCEHMRTIQDLWRVVRYLMSGNEESNSSDFTHDFSFPRLPGNL